MKPVPTRLVLALLLLALVAAAARGFAIDSLATRVKVGPGRIQRAAIARGEVVPAGGTARVVAVGGARVTRVVRQVGDRVERDDLLAELTPDAGGLAPGADLFGDADALRAPISGTVLARNLEPGDYVHPLLPTGALFEIADTSRLEVRLELDERDAAAVVPGAEVRIGDALARIERLAPRLERRDHAGDDAASRGSSTVRRAWAPVPAGSRWLVGEHLEARVALAPLPVEALAPLAAVTLRDGRAVVRVGRWPLVREQAATLGACDSTQVELRGVAPGTELVLP